MENARHSDERDPEPNVDANILTQEALMQQMVPILKSKGVVYRKYKSVFAKEATGGEEIKTSTSDGSETTNTAAPGDFIVKNQTSAQEMYVVKREQFHQRYQFDKTAADGFSEYRALGKVVAIELDHEQLMELNFDQGFYFSAPWGEKTVAKENDFLVTPPDYSEVYRIAKKRVF